MPHAIECQNLSKVYPGRVEAVRNLTLSIEPRQVYGFLGPNGAGKTTTIRMLLDLIRPTSGSIAVFGEPVRRNPSALKKVGALVEGASFYPYLSGWDNLQVYGWTGGTFDPHRANELIEAMGLLGREKDAVGKYSTGMKQRLGIAAALLHDPQLVILDEPTNGLDPAGIYTMRTFIRKLVDEEGKTVFLSSHLLGEVQQICDRVAIIHKGNLLAEGRVDDLLHQRSTERLLIEAYPIARARSILANQWEVSLDSQSNVLVVLTHREGIPQIVRTLAAAEIDIYAMQRQYISLEEFFLSITGREAGV
jgi:ABC-2 type transport system ATP-binding protein